MSNRVGIILWLISLTDALRLKIIKTEDDQASINSAVAKLNK